MEQDATSQVPVPCTVTLYPVMGKVEWDGWGSGVLSVGRCRYHHHHDMVVCCAMSDE
jgi:hypothetical protein